MALDRAALKRRIFKVGLDDGGTPPPMQYGAPPGPVYKGKRTKGMSPKKNVKPVLPEEGGHIDMFKLDALYESEEQDLPSLELDAPSLDFNPEDDSAPSIDVNGDGKPDNAAINTDIARHNAEQVQEKPLVGIQEGLSDLTAAKGEPIKNVPIPTGVLGEAPVEEEPKPTVAVGGDAVAEPDADVPPVSSQAANTHLSYLPQLIEERKKKKEKPLKGGYGYGAKFASGFNRALANTAEKGIGALGTLIGSGAKAAGNITAVLDRGGSSMWGGPVTHYGDIGRGVGEAVGTGIEAVAGAAGSIPRLALDPLADLLEAKATHKNLTGIQRDLDNRVKAFIADAKANGIDTTTSGFLHALSSYITGQTQGVQGLMRRSQGA